MDTQVPRPIKRAWKGCCPTRPIVSTTDRKEGGIDMATYTVVRSRGAIALGAICALGTAVVLFWHVRALADITTQHVMIALALLVSLGAGHLLWKAGWRHPGSALAFLVLFLAGTAICVTLSAGRGAELIHNKADDALHENAKRIAHEARIASARTDLSEAKEALQRASQAFADATSAAATECNSGPRLRCEGKTKTARDAESLVASRQKSVDQTDARYWVLVAQLADFKPEQVANVDLKQAAKVFAFLFGYDVEQAMQGLELLWPFIIALVTEFGTIAFLNYGFGHRRVATSANEERVAATFSATFAASENVANEEKEAVVTALQRAGRPLSNGELAAEMGVSAGESSKRVSALNGAVRKARIGRRVVISLPEQRLH